MYSRTISNNKKYFYQGERLFRRVGGGLPITWYWIDFKRVGPKSGPPLVEKVIDIFASRDRTSYIALGKFKSVFYF